jgi:hypothetical protein
MWVNDAFMHIDFMHSYVNKRSLNEKRNILLCVGYIFSLNIRRKHGNRRLMIPGYIAIRNRIAD